MENKVVTKFINKPENITKELLEGYVLAYSDQVALGGENMVVRTHAKDSSKVAIVTLGGAGHEPALSGFVGEGMLDCSVVGDVFAAPGAQRLFQALQLFKRDAGILLVVLNHSGDVMSANMATQLAERSGIKVKQILTHEDISAGLDTPDEDRRGLAGCVPLIKIIGAAAEQGQSLDEIVEIGERFNNQVANLAVAMGHCTHPQNGAVVSSMAPGEMEIGMGQHGEGGGGRQMLVSADDTAEKMMRQLIKKIQPKSGDKVLLFVNGVGASTHMELSIIYRRAHQLLAEAGIIVSSARIAEILTVQEMSGFQLLLAKLDPDHIKLLNAKSNAPYWVSLG